MKVNHQVVVFDAADLGVESRFWAGVLDGTVDEDGDWHMVLVDGAPRVGVQLAPDHVPRNWPDGTPSQQVHLDLWVEDFPTAHEKVISLGARVLKEPRRAESRTASRCMPIPLGTRSASAGWWAGRQARSGRNIVGGDNVTHIRVYRLHPPQPLAPPPHQGGAT